MNNFEELKTTATKLRTLIVEMLAKSGSGHPGGSLSIADIMAYLFFSEMEFSKKTLKSNERDRFVLSKGHAAPVLYAALALKGFFPEKDLLDLRQSHSHLQGHPHRLDTPGVEVSTGSLGQGLSMAAGIAIGLKLSKLKNNVYCIIGDGESQEGQIWEAITTAGFRKLGNLCVILDSNNLQIDGKVTDIRDMNPVKEKWMSFHWNYIEIDGHNFEEIKNAFDFFNSNNDKPTVIKANTVKGKGVSFMENNVDFHGVAPTQEELKIALKELDNE